MDAIQDVLNDLEAPAVDVSTQTESTPAAPVFDDRLWPAELKALLGNPHAVKLEIVGVPNLCPNCNGAGIMQIFTWLRGPMRAPNGGKVKWLEGPGLAPGWYTGETTSAPCPVCQEDGWREYLRANCGLKGADLTVSVESFLARGPYSAKAPALQAARRLLGQNASPKGFVTYYGEPGRGKSHLLKGLVNGFCGIGVYARYTNAADLLQEFRDHFSDNNGGVAVEAGIQHYRKVKVLAIDELDKVQLTDWSAQTLHRLLDARYNAQDELLTVLAMNAAPDQLQEKLAYLTSRMSGGIAVEVAGSDMRGLQGIARQRRLINESREGDDE